MWLPEGIEGINKNTKDESSEIIQSKRNQNSVEDELDEESKMYRNLLGLKIRGKINRSDLDFRYNERMKNYNAKRLSAMTENKRILAEEKR